MSWTDERVETLKKLWMEGLSASQIAGELGEGVTRNAVIGKVHRLKLSGRAKSVNAAPRPRTSQRSDGAPLRSPGPLRPGTPASLVAGMIKRSVMRTESMGATALAATPEPAPEAVASAQELFVPPAERVDLLRLNEHTCKWPIGDPLTTDFYFCGQGSEMGRPYCSFHARRAYHQVERRKR